MLSATAGREELGIFERKPINDVRNTHYFAPRLGAREFAAC